MLVIIRASRVNYFIISAVVFKFQGVFRITTKENVEYLVQAANDEERDEWTTAIANAIRRMDIKYKVVNFYNFNKYMYCFNNVNVVVKIFYLV